MNDEVAVLRAQIAGLAHDARGPLTVILGYAEILEDSTLPRERAVEAARAIRYNAERLAKLVDDASLT